MEELLERLILSKSKEEFYQVLENYFGYAMTFTDIPNIKDQQLSESIFRLYHLLFLNKVNDTTYDVLVNGLIQGIYRNEIEARNVMHNLKVESLDYFQVGILIHGEPLRIKDILEKMRVIHHMIYTINGCKAYILFTYKNSDTIPLRAMNEMLENYNARLYLSYAYSQLIDTSSYFKQCLLLSSKDYKEHLITASNHYIDTLFHDLSPDFLKSMIIPEIKLLLKYDQEHHTHYYDTLKCYLMNNYDVHAAIDVLEINRSTLFYRLNKISEILHVDIHSANLFYYTLSIYLNEIKE